MEHTAENSHHVQYRTHQLNLNNGQRSPSTNILSQKTSGTPTHQQEHHLHATQHQPLHLKAKCPEVSATQELGRVLGNFATSMSTTGRKSENHLFLYKKMELVVVERRSSSSRHTPWGFSVRKTSWEEGEGRIKR